MQIPIDTMYVDVHVSSALFSGRIHIILLQSNLFLNPSISETNQVTI